MLLEPPRIMQHGPGCTILGGPRKIGIETTTLLCSDRAGRSGIFGNVKIASVIDSDSKDARKIPLGCAPQGAEEGSIRKKNQDAAPLCVSDIDGAAGVHRDPRRMAYTRVLKGLERSASRFKFVDKAGGRVSKENVAERITRESYWPIELAGAIAFVSPRAEELERWRGLRFRRRLRASFARNKKIHDG